MQNLTTIKKIIATLFTLVMLWGGILIAQTLIQQNDNHNVNYIPSDAYFVGNIDGRQLVENGLHSILIEEDNDILNLVDNIFTRKSGDQEPKSLGIVFHSNVIIFKKLVNNNDITGIIFNLSNSNKFESNIQTVLKKNQVFSSNGDIGMILSLSTSSNDLSSADLQMHAEKLMHNKSEFEHLDDVFKENDSTIFSSWSKRGLFSDSDIISGSTINFSLAQNKIGIDGSLSLLKKRNKSISRKLKPAFTHLSSTIISQPLSDSINSFLQNLNLPKADIAAVSMNYKGTSIVEEPSFFIVPQMELLISTNAPYDIKAALDSVSMVEEDVLMESDHFSYGGQDFYFHQLNRNSFYIGINKNPETIDIEPGVLFELSGELTHLTEFYGKGMMRKFLEIIPLFSASKQLSNKIDHINVTVQETGDQKAELRGEVTFKEDHQAMNALIHFAIEGHLIK